ncbi:MAG: DnaA N-terminal domain-containing protein, partial [Planctomycetota bacterium]
MDCSTTKKSTDFWEDVLDVIENKIGLRQYNLWFKNTRLISFDNESLSIGVPNQFVQTKIRENYEQVLKNSVKNITKINPSINLLVDDGNGSSQESSKEVIGNVKF